MKTIYLILSLLLMLTVSVSADTIRFDDFNNFESAIGNFVVEDFDVNPGRGPTTMVFGDITISASSGLHGSSNFGATSGLLASENGSNMLFSFAPGVKAFGAEFGELFGSRTASFTVRDVNGSIVDSASLIVANNSSFGTANTTFYGWVSDDIDLASVTFSVNSFEAIDNMIVSSQANTIPEPSTYLFVLISLVIFGFSHKRSLCKSLPTV